MLQKKSSKKKKKDDEESTFNLDRHREAAVGSLVKVLNIDMSRLWKMGVPEEEFVNLFCRTSYFLLEAPATLKNKTVRENLIELLAIPAHQCQGFATTITSAVLQMLNTYEHLCTPLAELCLVLKEKHNNTQLASEILREMGKMDLGATAAHDASGVKNLATFLSELSLALPGVVLAHISMVVPHLNGGKEVSKMKYKYK